MPTPHYRVLLLGSGGREHALAWRLAESPTCSRLMVIPGNPGIAAMSGLAASNVVCLPGSLEDHDALLALAVREGIDLVVCGPEGPLVAGLGDACAARGILFFGPTQAAAEIEGSKAFAKALMVAAGVPTAAYGQFDSVASAEEFIDAQPGDVVVKADGLCAGKGVVVAASHEEAKAAVREIMGERRFGDAGARVVIEERLHGREVSLMALCDGERFVLLPSAEDHKTIDEGDRGPNTGGMGAYSPSALCDDVQTNLVAETIFRPTVRAMALAGRPFRGLLYAGLMFTGRGPMVIEWNARFGDPETQAVLARLDDDLLPWLIATAQGALPTGRPRFTAGTSLCVVLAAHGYPGQVRRGDVISGLPAGGRGENGVVVLHAGTEQKGADLVTAGGRVLGVTGQGSDLEEARARVYKVVDAIDWPGKHVRRDIGLRGAGT